MKKPSLSLGQMRATLLLLKYTPVSLNIPQAKIKNPEEIIIKRGASSYREASLKLEYWSKDLDKGNVLLVLRSKSDECYIQSSIPEYKTLNGVTNRETILGHIASLK